MTFCFSLPCKQSINKVCQQSMFCFRLPGVRSCCLTICTEQHFSPKCSTLSFDSLWGTFATIWWVWPDQYRCNHLKSQNSCKTRAAHHTVIALWAIIITAFLNWKFNTVQFLLNWTLHTIRSHWPHPWPLFPNANFGTDIIIFWASCPNHPKVSQMFLNKITYRSFGHESQKMLISEFWWTIPIT